ncbi:MAG: hypothetical protein GY726_09180 [Proteobacteria bacterium]|nr:hypothetical protein [Pseudomonadota bacterium]
MNKILRSIPLTLLSVLMLMPLTSKSDELDVEQLMKELENQLQISREKYETLKPELESALEAKSKELSSSLDSALDQGLAGLEKMGEQYDAASKASSEKLNEIMESDEVEKYRDFLSGLDEEAIRRGRDQLVVKFIEVLQLSADQVEAIKPLLGEKLEHLGAILNRYLDENKSDFEQFRAEFKAEVRKNVKQFKEILNPEQFEKYEEQLNSIEETIKNDVFET